LITIEEINPSGLFSFGEVETIKIPDLGFCRVLGRNMDDGGSNGAGKTSFLNAIPQLLFGESESDATATKIVNDVWGKGCNAHVIFTDAVGDRYKVVLKRSWKGTKTDDPDGLTLYYWDGQCWDDRRGENVHKTKDKIKKIIRFSYQQFLAMSYMAQRAGLRFVDEPSIRPKVFTEMLDLGVYDKAAEIARKRVREVSQRLFTKETARDVAKQSIEDEETNIEEVLKDLDSQLEKLLVDQSGTQNELKDQEIICADMDKKVRDQEVLLSGVDPDIREISHKWETGVREIKQAPVPGISDIEVKLGVSNNEIKRLKAELSNLLTDAAQCPKCGSTVTKEHLEAHRYGIDSELGSRELELKGLQSEKVSKQDEHQRWIEASVLKLTIEKDQLLEPLHNKKNVLVEVIETYREGLEESLQKELDIQSSLSTLNSEISQVEGQRTTWKSLAESLEQKKKSILVLIEEIEGLQRSIEIDKWIEKGFKQLKLHLFEEALVMMNELVNKYLDLLCDGKMSVTFDTRKLKAGAKAVSNEDYIDSLSVFVQHGRKTSVALEEYSGAEKQVIALALVASFWELVSATTQSGTNILMLDEIFGSLDWVREDGVIRFLDYLRGMGKTVLVTDNTGVCDDAVEFENNLVAEKVDDITRLLLEAA